MANEIQTAPNTTPTTDADWAAELNLRELSMKGYDGISLTEWAAGDTDKPQIAAGSVIEIDGAIAKFTNQTALTDEGGLADGWCYIKFVVSGSDVVPTLTNTFGTWDTAKQGFYTAGNRFSLHAMYRSGAVTKIFTQKGFVTDNGILIQTPLQTDLNAPAHIDYTSTYYAGQKIKTKIIQAAGNGAGTLSIAHGITNALTNRYIIGIDMITWTTAGYLLVDGGSTFLYWYYDATNLSIVFSAATPATNTYQVVIRYL